jgi:hypothetical protein
MPIEYLPAPDPSWEPLYDQVPIAGLDRHPTGEFVALRVTYQNGAAVWCSDTKRLAWHRDQARALSWTPDGNEVVLIRDDYRMNRNSIISSSVTLGQAGNSSKGLC